MRNERKPLEEQTEDSDSEISTSSEEGGDKHDGLNKDDEAAEDSPWKISSESSKGGSPLLEGKKSEPGVQKREFPMALPKSNASSTLMHLGRTPQLEVPRLLESIKFTVSCLYRLPIRKPAPLDRLKHKSSLESSYYQHFDVLYVKDKFPGLNSTVAVRLGKMITRRRQILYYREAHQRSLETRRFKPVSTLAEEHMTIPLILQGGPDTSFPEASSQNIIRRQALSQAASSHFTLRSKATTLRPGDVSLGPGDIRDQEVESNSLYARSVADSSPSMASSYAGKDIQVDVPARPKDRNGHELEMFKCPYCLITMHIRSKHKWK